MKDSIPMALRMLTSCSEVSPPQMIAIVFIVYCCCLCIFNAHSRVDVCLFLYVAYVYSRFAQKKRPLRHLHRTPSCSSLGPLAPFPYQGQHVRGHRAAEVQFLPGDGMTEAKGEGVQRLTRTEVHAVADKGLVGSGLLAAQNLVAAIAFVGKERMAYVPHVCPDLMRAPRFQAALHQGDGAETLQHSPVGDGMFARVAALRERQPSAGGPLGRDRCCPLWCRCLRQRAPRRGRCKAVG